MPGSPRKPGRRGTITIALLFEAVSKSEHIHALNHKKVLEKFTSNSGDAEIGNYEVKTTAENLQDAIKNETYELQTMYPKFIREAENEKTPEVAKTFTLAWESEKKTSAHLQKSFSVRLPMGHKLVCQLCGTSVRPVEIYTVRPTPGPFASFALPNRRVSLAT